MEYTCVCGEFCPVRLEHIKHALRLRDEGRYGDSIIFLKQCISNNPSDYDALRLLALNYMNTGWLVIAIGFYNKAIALNPAASIERFFVAYCILKYSCYEGSLPYFYSALRFGVDGKNIWLAYGEALLRTGRYKVAYKCLTRSIKLEKFDKNTPYDSNRAYSFLFRVAKSLLAKPSLKLTYHDSLVDRLKRQLNVKDILCVGDSHVLLLDNIATLDVVQTGSPTAYNLLDPSSTESGLPQISLAASKYNPKATAIMLTYAEIDIRCHIHKHASLKKMSYEASAEVVVDRYFSVIQDLRSKGFTILVNGPFGSGIGVPRFGAEVDRNVIAYYIDQLLRQRCNQDGIYYCSLYDLVVDSKFETNSSFVGDIDENHLNHAPEFSFVLLSRFVSCTQKFLNPAEPLCVKSRLCRPLIAVAFSDNLEPILPVRISKSGLFDNGSSRGQSLNSFIVSLEDHMIVTRVELCLKKPVSNNPALKLAIRDGNFKPLLSLYCKCDKDMQSGPKYIFECESTSTIQPSWYLEFLPEGKLSLDDLSTLSVFVELYTMSPSLTSE